MKFLKNLREPITSLIGIVVAVITISGIYKGTMVWQWEGLIGISVAALFLVIPDKIVVFILEQAQKISDKLLGKTPPQE